MREVGAGNSQAVLMGLVAYTTHSKKERRNFIALDSQTRGYDSKPGMVCYSEAYFV